VLTPQGKIIADFILAEAPATDGVQFFLGVHARSRRRWCSGSISHKLRAKVIVEDLSELTLGDSRSGTAWERPDTASAPPTPASPS
jgi:hypothetical protein